MKLAIGLQVVDFQRILDRSKHIAGWLELAEDWLELSADALSDFKGIASGRASIKLSNGP